MAEQSPHKGLVVGSIPTKWILIILINVVSTFLAQLVEQMPSKHLVIGSSPVEYTHI